MKEEWKKVQINFVQRCLEKGMTRFSIAKAYRERFGSYRSVDSIKHCIDNHCSEVPEYVPKVLVFDIETAPMSLYGFGLYDQNFSINQMIEDSFILSWSAKWLGSDEVLYADQRNKKGKALMNDKTLVKKLLKLMNEADIVIGQNSNSFDIKVVNFRIGVHRLPELNSFGKLDTKVIAKRHMKLPSYSLEYMSQRFNKKYFKSSHPEFSGFALHRECMNGNIRAFNSMDKYNRLDVLATEELFVDTLSKFDKSKLVKRAMDSYNKFKNK